MKNEIKLYDSIGSGGITAKEFTDAIPLDAEEITVRINSLGGSVGDGLAMYNYLKDHSATVTTIVDGYAASMGSIVALAGDHRQVHKSSMIMIHQPWGMSCGNADEMREQAEVLDEHSEALLSIYQDATGMEKAEIKTMLDSETWMRGECATEYGFATEVIDMGEDDSPEQAAALSAFASMINAITEGNELMSKQKTRKEVVAEVEELNEKLIESNAKIEEISAQQIVDIDAISATHAEEIVAKDAQLEEVNGKVAELEQAQSELSESVELIKAEKVELEQAKSEAVEELAGVKAELEQAKETLLNPAVKDAQLEDVKDEEVPAVVADAEADEAEAKALEEKEVVEPQNVLEEYEAMEAGASRKAFLSKNRKAIFALYEKRA